MISRQIFSGRYSEMCPDSSSYRWGASPASFSGSVALRSNVLRRLAKTARTASASPEPPRPAE
jgi:hypothetical protein